MTERQFVYAVIRAAVKAVEAAAENDGPEAWVGGMLAIEAGFKKAQLLAGQGHKILQKEKRRAAAARRSGEWVRRMQREIANPRCGCSSSTVRDVLQYNRTCRMGGCPYGGDF